MNARTAIDLAMRKVDLLDVGAQTGIFSAMLARFSAVPGIIATLGDLERLAEHRDRVVVVVLGNERKAQSWLREKMPSAFFRMSRSWRRISTSRAETPDFLFLSSLMTAAGKGLLTMLSEELTPMVKCTVGNPQIAGNLGQRFVAGFHQLNRFQFELFRKRSLCLLHGLFPSWRMSTSSSLPSPLSRVKTKQVF